MTCRCSSGVVHAQREADQAAASRRSELEYAKALTPDATKYEIVDLDRVGAHLVVKVRYPNCTRCSYEGNKVLVFLNVTEKQALLWREIDPHFRPPDKLIRPHQAPSPAARFPASPEGWRDALQYAKSAVGTAR